MLEKRRQSISRVFLCWRYTKLVSINLLIVKAKIKRRRIYSRVEQNKNFSVCFEYINKNTFKPLQKSLPCFYARKYFVNNFSTLCHRHKRKSWRQIINFSHAQGRGSGKQCVRHKHFHIACHQRFRACFTANPRKWKLVSEKRHK